MKKRKMVIGQKFTNTTFKWDPPYLQTGPKWFYENGELEKWVEQGKIQLKAWRTK